MNYKQLKKNHHYYYLDYHCQYIVTYVRADDYVESQVNKKLTVYCHIFKVKKVLYVNCKLAFIIPNGSQIVLLRKDVINKVFKNPELITTINDF